jgi:hypothetical protein
MKTKDMPSVRGRKVAHDGRERLRRIRNYQGADGDGHGGVGVTPLFRTTISQ